MAGGGKHMGGGSRHGIIGGVRAAWQRYQSSATRHRAWRQAWRK